MCKPVNSELEIGRNIQAQK